MKTTSATNRTLLFSLVRLAGLLIAVQGFHAMAEKFSESASPDGWRRTRFGWEHADSLPAKPEVIAHRTASDRSSSEATLAAPAWLVKTHRLTMPIAFAGFLGFFAPWCLLKETPNPS